MPQLARFTAAPEVDTNASTLQSALEAAFVVNPQQHAYDLVYRHGLAVADEGRHLLMGSTTGGLWASADAGKHWPSVSQNLPAVRFG